MPDDAAPGTAPRPRRRWRRRVVACVFGLLVTLGAAEIALRVLDLYPPIPQAYPGEHVAG